MNKLTLAVFFLVVVASAAQVSAQDCEICELVVGRIDAYLKNNATDAEILGYLNSDCKALGNQQWITTCQTMVKKYGPEIIAYIVDTETPELACKELGLCTSDASMVKNSGAVDCIACQFLAKQVEQYVVQNKTEQEILSVLDTDCSLLHEKNWILTVCILFTHNNTNT